MRKKIFLFVLLVSAISIFAGSGATSSSLGVSDDIKIYPMPIVSTASITGPTTIYKIEVYNLLGSVVIQRYGEGTLDFSNLPRGYYLLKVQTETGEVVKRIQKQ